MSANDTMILLPKLKIFDNLYKKEKNADSLNQHFIFQCIKIYELFFKDNLLS